MSSSQHPVALRLERAVGADGKLLATVMLLPLVDGIFPALVLSGALDSVAGIVQVGLLVFGGSATLAVVLAELAGDRRDIVRTVLLVGVPLLALAGLEAALAPTIAGVLDLDVFRRFAAVVIAAVAAKTASARVGEYLPRPAVVVGLGLVASVDPAAANLVVRVDPALVARGLAAGAVGVAFALGVAATAPYLRRVVDVDRFRFGSAVALGLLPLSLLGLPFGGAPLAVIAVTAVFAYAPASEPGGQADGVAADGPEVDACSQSSPDAAGVGPGDDGGLDEPRDAPVVEEDGGEDHPFAGDQERAPWL
jgi:hypothetical protein